MSNRQGFLPKAERSELDEDFKRRLDTWFEKAYEDDNLFLTMARRPDLLQATYGFIGYVYGGQSVVEPELFELCRIRMAWNNECFH